MNDKGNKHQISWGINGKSFIKFNKYVCNKYEREPETLAKTYPTEGTPKRSNCDMYKQVNHTRITQLQF